MLFCARARVLLDGEEIASDYLGNCIYPTFKAFDDHIAVAEQNRKYAEKGESGRCGSYFKDMIATVISEAREHVATYSAPYVRN